MHVEALRVQVLAASLDSVNYAYGPATPVTSQAPHGCHSRPQTAQVNVEALCVQVLAASSDSVNYAYRPATLITAQAPTSATAGRRLLEAPVSAGNMEKAPLTPQQQAAREAAATHAAKIARPGSEQVTDPFILHSA